MRKQKPKINFILIIGLLLFISVLFLAFYSFGRLLKECDFFKIKGIIIKGHNETNPFFTQTVGSQIDLFYLKGRNIFTLDLQEEQLRALQLYPVCKQIKLIKILPNRIFADFIIRKPVAYLKLDKYFYVDEDGMLLDIPVSLEQFDLPVISGLQTKISGPKTGHKYKIKELAVALGILKKISGDSALKGLCLKMVDVSELANTSFFLLMPLPASNYSAGKMTAPLDIIEVKIGQEGIGDKIDILGSLFVQARNDWANIKYIDLRFKEPVVKFKDTINGK